MAANGRIVIFQDCPKLQAIDMEEVLDSTSLPIALRNRPCGLRQSVTLQIGIRGMATIRVAPMQVLHSCIKC